MGTVHLKLLTVTVIALVVLAFAPVGQTASASDQFAFKLPAGIPADLWAYFIPRDNPLTPAKVELGRQLFFDKRLSADGSVSCGSCHEPRFAFADGKKTAVGIGGRTGARNTPTILNAMFNSTLFWDGRSNSLEAQSKEPLVNPDEMGNASHEQVAQRIAAIPEYAEQFQKVFGRTADVTSLTRAIAAYERTLVSANAPFDRFQAGDRTALSDRAQAGLNLFRGKARCSVCHNLNNSFPFLTDGNYRNTGVAANFAEFGTLSQRALSSASSVSAMSLLDQQRGKGELGRFMVSGDALDIGSFRTPSLRNVELTAPYFHDGSAATLADVVRYYVRGGNQNISHDWELQTLELSDREQQDLIEFLKSLTSDEARREAKQ
jgi:cytochrome c peroxidase